MWGVIIDVEEKELFRAERIVEEYNKLNGKQVYYELIEYPNNTFFIEILDTNNQFNEKTIQEVLTYVVSKLSESTGKKPLAQYYNTSWNQQFV